MMHSIHLDARKELFPSLTPTGHQAQVDFAELDFPWGSGSPFSSCSPIPRALVRFYEPQDMSTLFAGLEEAFRFFGGLARELLFDQMKAIITADLRLLGGQLVVDEEFSPFCGALGLPAPRLPPLDDTKGE